MFYTDSGFKPDDHSLGTGKTFRHMKSIFVANLSVSVTEVALGSLFEAYGTVERVSIMTDRHSGQAKEFGFVDMSDDAEAVKAIAALNGKDVEGRTLTVNEACRRQWFRT